MTNAEMQMANLREKIGDEIRANFVEDALNFWHFEPIKFESNAGFSFRNKFGERVYAKSFEDIFARRDNAYLAAAELQNKWVYYCAGICKMRGFAEKRTGDPCVNFYTNMKRAFSAIIGEIQPEFYGDAGGGGFTEEKTTLLNESAPVEKTTLLNESAPAEKTTLLNESAPAEKCGAAKFDGRINEKEAEFIADFLDFWNCELEKSEDGKRWRLKKHFGARFIYVDFYSEILCPNSLTMGAAYKFFYKRYSDFCERTIKRHKKRMPVAKNGKARFYHKFNSAFEAIMDDIQRGFSREALDEND